MGFSVRIHCTPARRKLKMVTSGAYDQLRAYVNYVMALFITGYCGNYHYGSWLAAGAGDDVHDVDGDVRFRRPG